MPLENLHPVRIAGTGSYVPEKILTNAELEKMVDTSDEWIVSRTGIKERRIAAEHESTSDMAAVAAERDEGLVLGADAAGPIGVAPDAEWIAVRAFDARGETTDLRLLRADRDDDDFLCGALLFQTHGLLNRDLVEGVHRHLDVGKINTGTIRFDTDFNIVVNYPLNGH